MPSYIDELRATIEAYQGPYKDQIRWLPQLHDFLIGLYEDTRLTRSGRNLANAALAYVLLPFDVVPETSMGGYGYIDDLYLAAEVLNVLYQDSALEELLEDAWPHERLLGSVLAELLTKTAEALDEDERQEILRLSGLGE